MKITLTGKQVDIGDRLRSHVEENILNSVNKYFSAPISCNVYFSKERDDFCAEVTVHPAKNIVLKGSGVAGDPYSAFDNANAHIATRLRRHKTKLNDHKGKTSLAEIANEAVFRIDETQEEIMIGKNIAFNAFYTCIMNFYCDFGYIRSNNRRNLTWIANRNVH